MLLHSHLEVDLPGHAVGRERRSTVSVIHHQSAVRHHPYSSMKFLLEKYSSDDDDLRSNSIQAAQSMGRVIRRNRHPPTSPISFHYPSDDGDNNDDDCREREIYHFRVASHLHQSSLGSSLTRSYTTSACSQSTRPAWALLRSHLPGMICNSILDAAR